MHKNGKIWAESEGEGFGSTFFVHVPLHSRHYVPDASYLTLGGSVETRFPINQIENFVPMTPSAVPSRSFASIANLLASDEPEGKHLELMPLPLQHPVEELTAWKPTILVVDDSSMNRKVDTCVLILSYRPYHPPSHTTPLAPIPSPPHPHPPAHPPHPHPHTHTLDAGPHVDRQRICLS